jgi:hypothetical protein
MKRNRKRVFAAVLAVCALAAGGAAFTAEVGGVPAAATLGFAQTHITGATAAGIDYALSSDGQYVNQANIYFTTANTPGAGVNVYAGFGNTATDATLLQCAAPTAVTSGTYNGDNVSTCDYTAGGTQTGVPVDNGSTDQYFDVSVSDSNSSGN